MIYAKTEENTVHAFRTAGTVHGGHDLKKMETIRELLSFADGLTIEAADSDFERDILSAQKPRKSEGNPMGYQGSDLLIHHLQPAVFKDPRFVRGVKSVNGQTFKAIADVAESGNFGLDSLVDAVDAVLSEMGIS